MWENNPLDSLDMFSGSPIDKWRDVIFNASKTLAHKELERILEELALYEIAFEMIEDSQEVSLKDLYFKVRHDEKFKEVFQNKKNSLAIESTSKILSDNE